jgi:hypothetical protein
MADPDVRDDAALIERLRRMPVAAAAEQLAAVHRLKRSGAAALGGAPAGDRERPKPDALDLGFDAVRFALDTWARWKREIEAPQIDYVTRALARASAPGAGAAQGGRLVVDLGDVRRQVRGQRRFRVENPGRAARRVLVEPVLPRTVSGAAFTGTIALVRADGPDPDDFEVAGGQSGLFEVQVTPSVRDALGAHLASATVIVGAQEAGTLTLAFRVIQ